MITWMEVFPLTRSWWSHEWNADCFHWQELDHMNRIADVSSEWTCWCGFPWTLCIIRQGIIDMGYDFAFVACTSINYLVFLRFLTQKAHKDHSQKVVFNSDPGLVNNQFCVSQLISPYSLPPLYQTKRLFRSFETKFGFWCFWMICDAFA